MITYFAVLSSGVTIRPGSTGYPERLLGSAFANEPYAFQLAMRSDDAQFCPVSVQVTGDIPIRVWREEYLPIPRTVNGEAPGLFPDPLTERKAAPVIDEIPHGNPWTAQFFREHDTAVTINVSDKYTTALWVDCNPAGITLPAGTYPITVRVISLDNGRELCKTVFTLTVYDAVLPAHTAYYTNWFHCDCLADTYGIPVYSGRFWEIFENWIKNAAENGMTTLLLPAFTPAFDTPVGTERMNVQLTDITETGEGEWSFDFSRLETFIDRALACGIRYFEHAPFFSQWGAEHAPNIYVKKPSGETVLRFGWDTDAGESEYGTFLRAYLRAFFAFADKKGIRDRMVYHISDEPSEAHLTAYKRSLSQVQELLRDEIVIDALFHVQFYRDGIVQTPVCELAQSEKFTKALWGDTIPLHRDMGDKQFWLYHTGGPRLISQPYWKMRGIGLLLYRYGANGFLHWGYNYYYDRMSQGLFSPLVNPCGYKQMPGPSYLVYPAADGSVLPSIREKQMRAAFCDLRALWLAEERYGRTAVMTFTEARLGAIHVDMTLPEEAFSEWRDDLNAWIGDRQ